MPETKAKYAVAVNILPPDEDLVEAFGEEARSMRKSDIRTGIIFNPIDQGYMVFFNDNIYESLTPSELLTAIANPLIKNLENAEIKIIFGYHNEDLEHHLQTVRDVLTTDVIAESLFDRLKDSFDDKGLVVKYVSSGNIADLMQKYVDVTKNVKVTPAQIANVQNPKPPKYIPKHQSEPDDDSDIPFMNEIRQSPFNFHNVEWEEYDDDEEDERDHRPKKRKKKKTKTRVPVSYIYRASRNPKKMYERHGIMIAKNNKAIKRDKAAIKEFLKDFIPGGGWRKEFRDELATRWIDMYAMTEKTIDYLNKQKRKSNSPSKKIKTASGEVAREFTKMLFDNKRSLWNDPTR